MSLVRYTAVVITVVFLMVLLIVGVLSVTRSTPVTNVIAMGDHEGPPAVSDTLFARTFELFTGTHVLPGNSVQLLLNGDGSYPPLWRDIDSARRTITVQMYYSQPGKVANMMRDRLAAKARSGVRVLVLLDGFGSGSLRRSDFVPKLRAAGAQVAWLRPLRWYTLNLAATRSHARVVVVDGRVAYTGGLGLADYWLGSGRSKGQWRDSNIRFEGPAVAALQTAFASAWAEATGNLITGDLFFPKSAFQPVGDVQAGLLYTAPTVGSTPAERYLALSLAGAQKTLYITNSYFVPNADFRDLLKIAAKRGVDVRVLTVSDATDVKPTWYAGRSYYEELLRAGVRIYEYQPSMIHSKTMVVDGLWSSVGSLNFDNRSMAFNNETVLVALDAGIGAQMDSTFLEDLTYSREITLPEFSRRGLAGRVMEWGAQKLWRLL